ncbi:MAG: histidinol dehydrogenase [Gammaproteobacteria bacterium]|nr:histidinol dehydrogenase [Gammaproteobacteria bacterium]
MISIRKISESDADFSDSLRKLSIVMAQNDPELTKNVIEIVSDVRDRGDDALIEYTNRFDRRKITIDDIEVPKKLWDESKTKVSGELIDALEYAASRISSYAEHQKAESWVYQDSDGVELGQQITAIEKAGIYVPGGKATYPSSVLMNCIPARVAGVDEVIMVVPAPEDNLNPVVLAAASIAGVDRVFSIGGAQAIAALAYGTQSVPQVDKIVGPGNRYVAEAKRLVFGTVGIDMIAGPSEVLIITDGSCNPDWIAMDMFAQAEHDEDARSILVSTDEKFIDEVFESINKLLPEMERRDIIARALENHGALISVASLESAIRIINQIAPEHLELALEQPESMLPEIRCAGAIFLGPYSSESLGDYCAGPNHVLPTARSARFSSPLGVYDFQKRTSIIKCSKESAGQLAHAASTLARGEGLTAHARSAEMRASGKS